MGEKRERNSFNKKLFLYNFKIQTDKSKTEYEKQKKGNNFFHAFNCMIIFIQEMKRNDSLYDMISFLEKSLLKVI